MVSVIVVFPKQEDAMNIRRLLVQNGIDVIGVSTTGAQAIQQMDGLDGGVVVCGYKFSDMMYSDLHDFLPPNFEML
ncbi:MAG TPA: antitermination regulator, partial [Lachnospiraceae bacterium]|nr:antitermination regulator [Lachnospiraceae bacterium]